MEPQHLGYALITLFGSVAASSGFWAYFTKRSEKKSSTNKLLIGIAQDRIIVRGSRYISRGSITKNEYYDFVKYLYEPYIEAGGNGLVENIMNEIHKLPVTNNFEEKE